MFGYNNYHLQESRRCFDVITAVFEEKKKYGVTKENCRETESEENNDEKNV